LLLTFAPPRLLFDLARLESYNKTSELYLPSKLTTSCSISLVANLYTLVSRVSHARRLRSAYRLLEQQQQLILYLTRWQLSKIIQCITYTALLGARGRRVVLCLARVAFLSP